MKSGSGVLALVLASAVAIAAPAFAQDKKAAPAPKAADAKAPADRKAPEVNQEGRKVMLENDRVLVTENTYKPGYLSPMRERGVRVSRALTDGTIERTTPDGKKQTVQWKAGDVKYQPKETFAQKNVGKADWVVYTVTLK